MQPMQDTQNRSGKLQPRHLCGIILFFMLPDSKSDFGSGPRRRWHALLGLFFFSHHKALLLEMMRETFP